MVSGRDECNGNVLTETVIEFDVDTCDIIADALQESGYILTDMGDTGLFLSQREEKDNLMMATEQMPVYKPDELGNYEKKKVQTL
jgi:hypothetical protein